MTTRDDPDVTWTHWTRLDMSMCQYQPTRKWVGLHANKEDAIHFGDVHQEHRVFDPQAYHQKMEGWKGISSAVCRVPLEAEVFAVVALQV